MPLPKAIQASSESDQPKRYHWTAAQLDIARRKFITRGWPVGWMLRVLDWFNEQWFDPDPESTAPEQGIIRSQEAMCAQIGCSPKTLYTVLVRLDHTGCISVENRWRRGEDGLPHRRPNCMIPRRIVADAPTAVTAETAAPPPARKSRWLTPQHAKRPMSVILGAVEEQFVLKLETINVSELPPARLASLAGFYQRRAQRLDGIRSASA